MMLIFTKINADTYAVTPSGGADCIGRVVRYFPTVERRHGNRTYVYARWTAKTPQWRAYNVSGELVADSRTRNDAANGLAHFTLAKKEG